MSLRDRIPFLRRRRVTPEPIACQELVELVTEYLEGTLPDADMARLDLHLTLCDGCSAYVAQMRDTLTLVGHLAPEDVSEEAYAELGGVFAEWKATRD